MIDQLSFHGIRSFRPSAPAILDVDAAVNSAFASIRAQCSNLPRGTRIALTCGSRGIARMSDVVRAICRNLREIGLEPFIIPSMGSHGGATATGQEAVLAEYGITERYVGAPVVASMDTVSLGTTSSGIEVFMDRAAFDCGHVLVLNRVKMHTDFDGAVESGLMKMLAVGLGKIDGAQSFHQNSLRTGYVEAILSMARVVLQSGRIVGGIGLVENDRHDLCEIAAAPTEEVESLDRRLLVLAREFHGRLPFCDLDLLIVDEIGKNISGGGMDTKIIGRAVHPERGLTSPAISIRRIYVRDLTPETAGNAVGIGLADAIHERILPKVDLHVTYTNARTALAYRVAAIPMGFQSDYEALKFLWRNLGSPSPDGFRVAWIRNTLQLHSFAVTPACLPQLVGNDNYEIAEPSLVSFDSSGALRLHAALKEVATQAQAVGQQ